MSSNNNIILERFASFFRSNYKEVEQKSWSLIGGDFAGLSATFDPLDGSLIPIPERLIPEEMLQWGQEPKCLQVIVSESAQQKGQHTEAVRNTLTVLPDIGCSLDGLTTTREDDTFKLYVAAGTSKDETRTLSLQYVRDDNQSMRLETIFAMDDEYRLRVVMDLMVPSESSSSVIAFSISRPMVLCLERRTSSTSSSGQLANNGLDIRTLSEMLGPELSKSKTFVDADPLDNYAEPRDGFKQLQFPGNVGITFGWQPNDGEWIIEVCHVHNKTRSVVSRHFGIVGENVHFRTDAWKEESDGVNAW